MNPTPDWTSSHVRTRDLTAAALIAALLAASAWITVPVGAVPVTLQVFVVVLAALLLTPGWAAGAVGVYLMLGIAGLPVFAGGGSGFGVIAGPTGGYLLGFIAGATIGSAARSALTAHGVRPAIADAVAAGSVVVVVYTLGTLQLAFELLYGTAEALAVGVIPFILPDLIKAAVAIVVARAVRRAIRA